MISFKQDGYIVLALPESLDRHNAAPLTELIEGNLAKGNLRYIADAAKLTYIDSFGISVLLRESKRVQASGGEMRIRNLTGQPLDLVWLTGTDGFLVLEGSPDSSDKMANRSVGSDFKVLRSVDSSVEILAFQGTMCFPIATKVLQKEFEALLTQSHKVLLDFSNLNYLDSVSMSELLSFNHKLRRLGGTLRICCPNNIVKDILDAQNLRVIIPIQGTREEALRDLK